MKIEIGKSYRYIGNEDKHRGKTVVTIDYMCDTDEYIVYQLGITGPSFMVHSTHLYDFTQTTEDDAEFIINKEQQKRILGTFKGKKCQCGVDSVGEGKHDSWCPKSGGKR